MDPATSMLTMEGACMSGADSLSIASRLEASLLWNRASSPHGARIDLPLVTCVYAMRMARVNVYLPDDLAREAREAGLNISGLTQEALRSALAARQSAQWLDGLQTLGPTDVTHEAVLKAVAAAKDDLEGRG